MTEASEAPEPTPHVESTTEPTGVERPRPAAAWAILIASVAALLLLCAWLALVAWAR